ncbi:MAG: hypothetical protein EOO15_04020 [Chitinophagaceae bacterium]|nr:MAG: hypothetical protein EOO15_04020 [Chitinophagaceae bacterium]
MKRNTSLLLSFVLMLLACSLFRVWEGRPFGFAPQIAMAVFCGAIFRDKKLAFLAPLASMLISDALYHFLFKSGNTNIYGFYEGQAVNYILVIATTVFGFFIRNSNIVRNGALVLAAPTAYFLLSNFQVWIGGGGYNRPRTFDGLVQCMVDGLPFYGWSIVATVFFSAIFFGAWYALGSKEQKVVVE